MIYHIEIIISIRNSDSCCDLQYHPTKTLNLEIHIGYTEEKLNLVHCSSKLLCFLWQAFFKSPYLIQS